LRVKVGFTPVEQVSAPLGIVIDVLRATSTICQALASGYERVTCVGEIDDARALAGPGVALAGERGNVRIDGFDFGNSPREFADGGPRGSTLVLTTTNGTRAIVAASGRADTVLVGSIANLTACAAAAARAARKAKGDVLVQCAGVVGEFAIDDAYTAGRFVAELRVWLAEWEPSDAAQAAEAIAGAYPSAAEGLGASQSARNLRAADLADDVRYCAREGVLDIVPTVGDVDGDVALITVP
jgi:2-phosphosulfolactate phosphatase